VQPKIGLQILINKKKPEHSFVLAFFEVSKTLFRK